MPLSLINGSSAMTSFLKAWQCLVRIIAAPASATDNYFKLCQGLSGFKRLSLKLNIARK